MLVTPLQAPNANAYAERWVRTVRTECLDWLLIVGRGHLEQVLRIYVRHYNEHRPHRALGLEPPNPSAGPTLMGEAACADGTSLVERFMSTDELQEHIYAPYGPFGAPNARPPPGSLNTRHDRQGEQRPAHGRVWGGR